MNDELLLRYSRQIMLPAVDMEGQQKLADSRCLIVGLGGLGSPAAMYLAAAGVGTLVLNDYDCVDLSNLQRQIVHNTDDIGKPKVVSAAENLDKLNPSVQILSLNKQLDADELAEEVAAADIVLDCSDNFKTRFAVNRVCVDSDTPLVSGAAIRFEGQLAVFDLRNPSSPCYNCLYPDFDEASESCSQSGVIAPLPGIIGSMQALEALKLLSSAGNSRGHRVLLFDGLATEWNTLQLPKNPGCPTCSEHRRCCP